jgi:uncharacterized protein (TIGR00369 family)
MADFNDVPANRHLRFRLVERSGTRTTAHAVVAMDAAAEFEQETGVIHGGILTALADTAAVYCFMPELGANEAMIGVELKINFLRPALPGQGDVTARAGVLRRGRRLGVCEVDVAQGETHVARGLFTYLFAPREAEAAAERAARPPR